MNSPALRRAIFIDRDGTLIVDKDYLHKPQEVEFFKGAVTALKRAMDAGFHIVMVTNQSGVGRGYFTMDDVVTVHEHMAREMSVEHVSMLHVYVAPEAPDAPSRGRKPSPQFLFDARDEFGIDLSRSYMVGDKVIDLECGWNAGVRKSILVRTGYGTEAELKEKEKLRAALVVDDLGAAIEWVLKDSRQPVGDDVRSRSNHNRH
jgi:D-glycero-D-manno-heptose 1,7-bisphosphate phosphatase